MEGKNWGFAHINLIGSTMMEHNPTSMCWMTAPESNPSWGYCILGCNSSWIHSLQGKDSWTYGIKSGSSYNGSSPSFLFLMATGLKPTNLWLQHRASSNYMSGTCPQAKFLSPSHLLSKACLLILLNYIAWSGDRNSRHQNKKVPKDHCSTHNSD